MSLSELRSELKKLRKSATPLPISRMKKTDIARELERMKYKEEKSDVKEYKDEVKTVQKVVKKAVEKVQEEAHLVQEKKTKKPEVSVVHSIKYSKGSIEAKGSSKD